MSAKGRYEDLSTLLYLVPIAGGVLYALALWVQSGVSLVLPTDVYLTVTRDPILFMAGTLAVLLGLMIEVNGAEPAERPSKLASLGGTVQSIGIASLAIVLLSAWYSNGFTDLGGAATDFIVGRYGIVFPALMVLLSYLLTARFRLRSLADRKAIATIALLLVPASLYEIGKRQIVLGLGVAFVLILIGMLLLLVPPRKVPLKEE
ncbi:MAG: hypothetical protein JRM80_06070 [Nitrososphaerota archaeon]|nr:hypothetical protein [Nitrososphaerota archaeon]